MSPIPFPHFFLLLSILTATILFISLLDYYEVLVNFFEHSVYPPSQWYFKIEIDLPLTAYSDLMGFSHLRIEFELLGLAFLKLFSGSSSISFLTTIVLGRKLWWKTNKKRINPSNKYAYYIIYLNLFVYIFVWHFLYSHLVTILITSGMFFYWDLLQ